MNYAELIKSILPQVLLASRLINNPEIVPEVRRRNQEILFQEVGSAVYAKTYDMNAFDMNIEYTKGAGLDNRHYGLAKIASDSISNGAEIESAITNYIMNATATAQRQTFKIARESGETPTMERSLVGRENCKWCIGKAGKYVDPGPEAFDRHSSCVVEDTTVMASDIKSMQKIHYSGDVVKMTTANGRELTVTPNHIMLTSRGWVAAKNILKTDSVVNYVGWDKVAGLENHPDDKQSPASIKKVFASVSKSAGVVTMSVPLTAKDFKGDGLFGEGNIDIVTTDSPLGDNTDIPSVKLLDKHFFNSARSLNTLKLNGGGSLGGMLFALSLAADGIVSSKSLSESFFGGHVTSTYFASIAPASHYDTRLQEVSSDHCSGDAKAISDTVLALSEFISFDDVVDVQIDSFHGDVYDLSTISTLYIANGLITSNCDCKIDTRGYKTRNGLLDNYKKPKK